MNTEVIGDCVDACEPKNKQSDGERADQRDRGQAEARGSLERELPRATGKPSWSYVSREGFDDHRT